METDPLASLEELIELLPPSASADRAEAMLAQASRRFRGEARCHISRVEDDEVWLDGDGSRALLLPNAPVVDVASVEVDGAEVDASWSTDGVLRHPSRWPDRLRSVKVVYTHGHDPVPDDVQQAVLTMARWLYAVQPGVSSMQVGGQTVSTSAAAYEAGVADGWAKAVAAYRINRGDRP